MAESVLFQENTEIPLHVERNRPVLVRLRV
jgi:hypothetical protein